VPVSNEARNTFHASEGGARAVPISWTPKTEPEVKASDEIAPKEEKASGETEANEPDVTDLTLKEESSTSAESPSRPAAAPSSGGKSRVLFVYTCPSGSPIKFRMVYSSGVRGIQQDAKDKAGIEITAKVRFKHQTKLRSSSKPLIFPISPNPI